MKQLEIKKIAKDIWQKISPIKGVLYFMIILLVCHFLWKISFLGDAETRDASVTFWGIDISRLFTFWVNKLSDSVYFLLRHVFDIAVFRLNNRFVFPSATFIDIVWSCSGIKQAYIYICIIGFYPGPWKHKLWYIPAGLLVVYCFNVLRVTVIMYAVRNNMHLFDILHESSKYVFYAIIFLMWVVWEEKFNLPSKNKI